MTGRQKCNLMRQIRKKIAEVNDITYLSAECNNDGYCLGTCAKCDAEISYLDEQLNRKVKSGSEIRIAEIGEELLELALKNQMEEVKTENFPDAENEHEDENYEISDDLHMGIEELGLSVRSYNSLKRAGINTLEDLFKEIEKDMMGVRNIGRKTMEEVLKKAKEKGISLKREDE